MICNGPGGKEEGGGAKECGHGGKEEGGGAKECGHGVGNPPMPVTFNGLRKIL